jgi:hypothetical protein
MESTMPRTKAVKPTKARPEAQNGNGTTPRSEIRDLSELRARKTTVVVIYDPRDADQEVKRDTGYRFEIAPRWSPDAQKILDDYREQVRRLENGDVDRTDPKIAEGLLEQIVAVTRRFWHEPDSPDGIVLDGVLLTPSPENARKIFANEDFAWLYEDIIVAWTERGRFFGAPSKTA